MVVQTRNQSRLNPDDPKDADAIRQMLEESDDSDEEHESVYESCSLDHYPKNYAQETQQINIDSLQEDTHMETTREAPNFGNTDESDPTNGRTQTEAYSSEQLPHTRRKTQELSETPLGKSINSTLNSIKKRSKKLTPRPKNIPRTIVTRSRARQLCEIERKRDNPTIVKHQRVAANPLPEETDEDCSDTEGPQIAELQDNLNNIISCRDLHFLRKDNLLYFTDTQGNPVDVGAMKLFERQEMPKLTNLTINVPKLIKRGKRHHIILPISEEQKEGPTTILTNIAQAMAKLRKEIENLKFTSISIAKSDHILNSPWENILAKIQTEFSNSNIKIIICRGLIKYPPTDIREAILQEMHCSPVGGHRGVTKTYNRIRQNYYWENLKSDVRRVIQQCLQCQLKKLVRVKTKQPMVITDTPGWTFDKIAMDIVGPLPRTKNNNEYLLTIQDQLSKFCLAIPMADQTAATIADKLVKRFISIFGPPKAVLTDQGRNFVSDLMKKLAKYYRIRKFRTTAFHPQSNGSLERSHHALVEYLKQYVSSEKEWDEWVDLAIQNYNTSVHEGTKHTPYELVFGRPARIPSYEPLRTDEMVQTYDDYLIQLFTRLHKMQMKANNNLTEAKHKSKEHYDKRINPQTFKPGDYVFLLKGPKPGKFGDQYTGPHEVLEILNRNNVRIRLKKNSRVVHPNRLRKSYILPAQKNSSRN